MDDFRFKVGDYVVAKQSFVYMGARVVEGNVYRVSQIDPVCPEETILVFSLDNKFRHWFDDKYFDIYDASCEELDNMFSDFE